MLTKSSVALKTALLLAGLGLAFAVYGQDRWGAWKLNSAESKMNLGAAVEGSTVTVLPDENGIKFMAEGKYADGKPFQVRYDAKFDGKDYPVTGLPNADTVSLKRIDADTIEANFKKDKKITITVTWTVSKDGKTRTSTFEGWDAMGKKTSGVLVYDRLNIACGPRFCEKKCKGKCGNRTNCDCPA